MATKNRLTLLLALLAGSPASAAIFPVGTGLGCGYATIQAAVDHAATYPGDDDFIHVSRSLTYTQQAITVGNQTVQILGGFDNCQDIEPSATTTISGTGGSAASVLRILGNGRVTLRNLTISGGDASGGSEGGGIFFQGNGVLDIADSEIINNTAGYGGGIYARGSGDLAELRIGANVSIANNTARYSGGGVYIDQLEMSMREPNSGIFYNTAIGTGGSGYGGGLTIRGANLSAHAYIGSGGIAQAGVIFANEARYGGGVAVVGGDGSQYRSAELVMYTGDALHRSLITENFASVAGGALFLAGHSAGDGVVQARAKLYQVNVVANSAAAGAAAYLAGDNNSLTRLAIPTDDVYPDGSMRCPIGDHCGSIVDNVAADSSGNPTAGSILQAEAGQFHLGDSFVIDPGGQLGGLLIRGNRGKHLLAALSAEMKLANAVVVDNTTSSQLITLADGFLRISDSTIAGNAIGAAEVIADADGTTMQRSIVWQPGKTSITSPPGGVMNVTDTLASEIASLDAGPDVIQSAPRFVDPARGDYRLRIASPAVDYALGRSNDRNDGVGQMRNVLMNVVPDLFGAVDLGALELQHPYVLLLNANFDADANLWPSAMVGASSWAAGAVHVSGPGPVEVVGSSQCIHLPTAGRYRLNGRARVGTPTTGALLRWHFRRDGGEACTANAATRSGQVVLATTLDWTLALQPAVIDIAPAEWTANSSITVQLVGYGRQPDAWFDYVRLDYALTNDVIFQNGFD